METKHRCAWCEKDDLYRNYHDNEWGRVVQEDRVLFEFLILEGFQAGLSWITILKKRNAFREAFDLFDYGQCFSMEQARRLGYGKFNYRYTW